VVDPLGSKTETPTWLDHGPEAERSPEIGVVSVARSLCEGQTLRRGRGKPRRSFLEYKNRSGPSCCCCCCCCEECMPKPSKGARVNLAHSTSISPAGGRVQRNWGLAAAWRWKN